MPVGSANRVKRTASPERHHIYVANPAIVKDDEVVKPNNVSFVGNSDQALEKIKALKEKYGDASAMGEYQKKKGE
jgi:hypothetical protein